mgnify:FL=1
MTNKTTAIDGSFKARQRAKVQSFPPVNEIAARRTFILDKKEKKRLFTPEREKENDFFFPSKIKTRGPISLIVLSLMTKIKFDF